MMHILETLLDPNFWKDLGENILHVLNSGSPPVYVQYLIVTVIYLAYLLFVHDPRRTRNLPLAKWVGNPMSLVYFLAILVITAGVTDGVAHIADPQAIKNLKPSYVPVISDIFREQ